MRVAVSKIPRALGEMCLGEASLTDGMLTDGMKTDLMRSGIQRAERGSAMSSCAPAMMASLSALAKVFQAVPNATSPTGMWMRTNAAQTMASSNQRIRGLAVRVGISRGPGVSLTKERVGA